MNSGSGSGLVQGNGLDSSESSDEQDEPSSSKDHYEEVLENFRLKWKNELKISNKKNFVNKNKFESTSKEEDQELTAKNLFLKGVDLEKSGKLYEAIQFYRRAVQLVPDIEFRLEELKRKPKEQLPVTDLNESESNLSESESDDDSIDSNVKGDLLQTIQKKLNKTNYLCIPKFNSTETHISYLPPEIILYILRWVISSDLDIRSLEIFSQVCRGFYVCARDSEIWKSACERTWGLNCGNLSKTYLSWRQMFLERPKLYFNGCYISKTTYIRHGESSFQDQFYRPWHLVAYYRYLRFFPEGIVLMLTTPDEPSACVTLLKNRQPKSGTSSVLTGHYRLKDDTVAIYVNRQETKTFKRSRRKDDRENQSSEQTFHLELKIQNHHKRRHVQLIWTRYSIFTKNKTGVESNYTFDLIGNRFPPLWFSRVKSYTIESESPLI
nr:F-box only protein 9 [Onthophagus taurus]